MSELSPLLATLVLVVWFFATAAALGSFLNVIVWRMPRGISVGASRSRCPKCENPISFRDNVPIAGWLMLRGRCRNCGEGISLRYPIVEAVVAVALSTLLFLEVIGLGGNLPMQIPGLVHSTNWFSHFPNWTLIGICGYHSMLLYFVLGFALIDYDGYRVPARLWVTGLAAGGAALLSYPSLVVVPVRWGQEQITVTSGTTFVPGAIDALSVAAAGGVLGVCVALLLGLSDSSTVDRKRSCYNVVVLLGAVGAYLGWQAVLSVALLTAAGRLIAVLIPAVRCAPLALIAATATFFGIVLWKPLCSVSGWPGPSSGLMTTIGAVMLVGAVATLAGFIQRSSENATHEPDESPDFEP